MSYNVVWQSPTTGSGGEVEICQTIFGFTILYLDYLMDVIHPRLKPEGGPKVPRRNDNM